MKTRFITIDAYPGRCAAKLDNQAAERWEARWFRFVVRHLWKMALVSMLIWMAYLAGQLSALMAMLRLLGWQQ